MAHELATLEHEWMAAVRAVDLDRLDELLAPEFTLTTGRPGAEVRSRDEYLEVTENSYRVEDFAFEELAVEDYGDAAVVRSRMRQRARMDDLDRTGAYRMTDVWVRRDGRWHAVARHATAVERRLGASAGARPISRT